MIVTTNSKMGRVQAISLVCTTMGRVNNLLLGSATGTAQKLA